MLGRAPPLELEVEVTGVVDHGCVKQVVDGVGLPGPEGDVLVCGGWGRVHLQRLIVLGAQGQGCEVSRGSDWPWVEGTTATGDAGTWLWPVMST